MTQLKNTMWLFVSFDLPTKTPLERKKATKFRHMLLRKGFTMFQFSLYNRHCGKSSFTDVIERYVKGIIPSGGQVAIFRLTDLQYGNIELFYKGTSIDPKLESTPLKQLKLF